MTRMRNDSLQVMLLRQLLQQELAPTRLHEVDTAVGGCKDVRREGTNRRGVLDLPEDL